MKVYFQTTTKGYFIQSVLRELQKMHLPLSLLHLHKLDERQGNKLHAQSPSITEICYYKMNDQVTKLMALIATTHTMYLISNLNTRLVGRLQHIAQNLLFCII